MTEKFKYILNRTQLGHTAELKININGTDFIRIFRPKERLILLGGGHISKALCRFASILDFRIIVVDDRPSFANDSRFPEASLVICDGFENAILNLKITENDYVAVITRGHRYDRECLRTVLSGREPAYLGLLGSRKRTSALIAGLKKENTSSDMLDRIHTPIGIDIGALTVEEIAVSIIAEMIQNRRKNQKKHNDNNILAEETFHEDVLRNIADNSIPKALILVYETTGSTPVHSGCFMTLDKNFVCSGTIGGGCVESAAVKAAFPLISTGRQKTFTMDLSNDAAGDTGMFCGGTMSIFITDLTLI